MRIRQYLPAATLGLMLLVTAGVTLVAVRSQWFVLDEFDYLAPPEGTGWLPWLIAPHNEHTILFTKLWFSTLYSAIGLHGYWLYAAPMVLCHLAAGVAVYRLILLAIPSRVIALAGTAPVLLMGAGVGTVSWAGQFQYTAALAAGLWLLHLSLSPRPGSRRQGVWAVGLTVAGTLSGSAFIPLGITAALVFISLGRVRLGVVVGAVIVGWFVVSHLAWNISTEHGAHDIGQILRDGPEFVFAVLGKAIDDSLPVSGSFAPAILLASTLGAIGLLAAKRTSTAQNPRARRTVVMLLAALSLSLAVTVVGRLSLNAAEAASGGYSYFVLVVAIPLVVIMLARHGARTSLATTVIVLLLAGWTVTSGVALSSRARGLADWKSENAALLQGAAYLTTQDFPIAADEEPSPTLAPGVAWSAVAAMASVSRIDLGRPSPSTLDQLSLAMQWVATAAHGDGSSCEPLAAHETSRIDAGDRVVIRATTDADTDVTLDYDTSGASRAVPLTHDGVALTSVAGRDARLTAGDSAVTLCR